MLDRYAEGVDTFVGSGAPLPTEYPLLAAQLRPRSGGPARMGRRATPAVTRRMVPMRYAWPGIEAAAHSTQTLTPP